MRAHRRSRSPQTGRVKGVKFRAPRVLKPKKDKAMSAMNVLLSDHERAGGNSEKGLSDETIRRLSTAMEQSPVSIIMTNRAGIIEYVNPKVCQVTGYSEQEIIGMSPRMFKSGETSDEEYTNLWNTIQSGEVWRGEFHNRKKDGELFWEWASISPVRDGNNEITHFLAVKEDITEKKRLEAQLLRAQRMESIGTLATGVAHDLNNILAPILMSAPLLRMGLGNEEFSRIVNTIEKSAERGAQIVNQVLAFGRGLDGRRVPVQLSHLIKEIVKIATETFPKDIKIEFSLPKDLWEVDADATQLHQVLLNLCINSRDAMPNGGTLKIQATNLTIDENYASMVPEVTPGRYLLLEISDTGTGIPPKILDKIFDPFFTTKPVGKGTGLGLSTVLGIVKSHGGCITVESKRGTTFKIYLPVGSSTEAHNANYPGLPKKVISGHGEIVLIVDDESAVCEVTKLVLEKHGYHALLAHDGAEALALFASQSSDIAAVLTDVVMPVIDGVALIHVLRKMSPSVPIIAMSGHDENGRLDELESDLSAFLRKPFDGETLLHAVASVLQDGCVNKSGGYWRRA